MRDLLLLLVTSFLSLSLHAQSTATFAFYNVENLFDTQDDSLKQDEEFLPYGVRGWTPSRLRTKYQQIYKVIAGLSQSWQPPAVMALAEVENRSVLEGLLRHTPLHRQRYQLIHEESPDKRGIDVALLYDPAQFTYLKHQAIPIDTEGRPTRDILYVRGVLFGQDTVHCFVNHWPSRYGGVASSAPRRRRAAQVLRSQLDSLQRQQPHALVIITGDFNDNPTEASVRHVTNDSTHWVNISHYDTPGTHKYQGQWNTFDQFIVSRNLVDGSASLQVSGEAGHCFHPNWLTEEDARHLGYRPRRTYVGYRYQGGFSDHWPIYLQLRRKNAQVAEK